jgi:lipopolysaccharide biosynthesis regulator YciM
MHIKTLASLLIVSISAIGIAYVYIPSKEEQAVMHLKDKEFTKASEKLEKIYKEGDLSPTVARSLSQLYIQEGRVEKAIELLEKLLEKHPNDVEIRKILGKYYQYAQRSSDYVSNLEILNRLEMKKEHLDELSAIYNFNGDHQKQIQTLDKLITLNEAAGKHFVSLAYLYAQNNEIEKALNTLRQYYTKYNIEIKSDVLEFFVVLLLEKNHIDEALKVSSEWLKDHTALDIAERLVSQFQQKGLTKQAYQLLTPLKLHFAHNTRLEFTYATLQFQLGLKQKAYRRFKKLSDHNKISTLNFPYFTDIILDFGDLNLVETQLKKNDILTLPDSTLLKMVQTAAAQNNNIFINSVLSTLSEDFFEKRPLLATDIFLTVQHKEEAYHWLEKALNLDNKDIFDNIYLIELLIRAKAFTHALERLKTLDQLIKANFSILKKEDLVKIAKAYIRLGKTEDGLNIFTKFYQDNPTPIAPALMLFHAALGKENLILDFLDQNKSSLNFSYLEDLYTFAAASHLYQVATVSARLIYKQNPSHYSSQLLGTALFNRHNYEEAILYLKDHSSGQPDLEAMFAVALHQTKSPYLEKFLNEYNENYPKKPIELHKTFLFNILFHADFELAYPYIQELALKGETEWIYSFIELGQKLGKQEEIKTFLHTLLEKEQDINIKEKLVYVLINISGNDAALPYIKTLAEQKGGNWNFTYIESLEKNKKIEELRHFLKAWAQKPDTALTDKKNIAFQLLEKGFKQDGIIIFMNLLEKETKPQDRKTIINQLLYLWGPKPQDKEATNWLLKQATLTTNQNKIPYTAEYLDILLQIGENNQVLQFIERTQSLAQNQHIIGSYLKALVKTKNSKKVQNIFERTLSHITDLSVLYSLGTLAEGSEFAKVLSVKERQKIYERIVRIKPNEHKAIQQLAYISFTENEFQNADEYFKKFFTYSKGDYVSNYFYGEVLRLQKNPDAETYYERAMNMIHKAPNKEFDMLLMKSQILSHRGYADESIKTLEYLRHVRPHDEGIRADLAQFLLENNKNMEARAILQMQ